MYVNSGGLRLFSPSFGAAPGELSKFPIFRVPAVFGHFVPLRVGISKFP